MAFYLVMLGMSLTRSSHKRRKCRSSPKCSLPARAKRRNTSSAASRANCASATPSAPSSSPSRTPPCSPRKNAVSPLLLSPPLPPHPPPITAGKRWSPEKLAQRLEDGANTIKAVYSELPTYDRVVPALLDGGVAGLRARCRLEPGVPLKPMLAKPTKAIGEVLDRFEGKRFTCEYKYDGERAQVHRLEDGTIAVFSRNSEDMTKKYPEFVDQIPRVCVFDVCCAFVDSRAEQCVKENTQSFVLDAEAVAIDKDTGTLMPFQELSKRKRKDVKIEDIQVRVCLFAFDLIYLNGEVCLFSLVLVVSLSRAHL